MADPEYTDIALTNWYTLLTTLEPADVGPFVASATSAFLVSWPSFSPSARTRAKKCIDYIVLKVGEKLGQYLNDIADMTEIPELAEAQQRLLDLRKNWSPLHRMDVILSRTASNNVMIAIRAMQELKTFLIAHGAFVRTLLTGDIFDPIVTRLMYCLVSAVNRDDAESAKLREITFECIGLLGAIDPDRLEPITGESQLVIEKNFTNEDETITFSLYMLQNVMVDSLRAASDSTYLNTLMYAIQELLKKCGFSAKLLAGPRNSSTPLRVRNRWNALPKPIMAAVAPYLSSHYTSTAQNEVCECHPLYHVKTSYREWIKAWTLCLIGSVVGNEAHRMFFPFKGAIKYSKDAVVASTLLPHLALSVVQTGTEESVGNIRGEILAVLEDQVDPQSTTNADKQGLCAQVRFDPKLISISNYCVPIGRLHRLRPHQSVGSSQTTATQRTPQ